MTKITLTDLANLQNETTAVNAINTNNSIIEGAFDNTLSLDGTSPNSMQANFDMNSNRILNLPAADTPDQPVRKAEFDLISNGYTGNNTIAGTANQITVTSGGGTTTISTPAALTFTGKTVTNGTFNTPTISTPTISSPTISGTPDATTSKFIADGVGIINASDYGVGAAVSDNGAALNSLIALAQTNGWGVIQLPRGTLNVVTTISFSSRNNIVLRGWNEHNGGAYSGTVLQYAGSGSVITISGSSGIALEKLQIQVTTAAYASTAITIGGASSNCRITHCNIIASSGGTSTGINLDSSIETDIDCTTIGGFNIGLTGRSSGATYCNVVNLTGVQFFNLITRAINNPHNAWKILNCTFENATSGKPCGIGTSTSAPSQGLSIDSCWFGDSTVGGADWIQVSGQGIDIVGNFIAHNAAGTVHGVVCDTCNGVSIKSNYFSSMTNAIQFLNTVDNVDLEPNYYSSVSSTYSGAPSGYGSYHNLPNGMLMQYGSATVTTGTPLTITLPKAYTAAPISATLILNNPTAGANTAYITSPTSTNFVANVAGTAGSNGVYWTTIGYSK